MKFYFDRNGSIIQLVPEYPNMQEFVSVSVYLGSVSPLDKMTECTKLFEGAPMALIPVVKTFSNHVVGNLYAIGTNALGVSREIGHISITGNHHYNTFYDNMYRGLRERKEWYSKLRSEQAIIYFKSQNPVGATYNQNFDEVDPNSIMKGSGAVSGYIGSNYRVMVENDYKKVKTRDPNGKTVKVEALEGWIFNFPFVNDECLLQRENGDIFSLQNITYKHLGGQLIEESFNLVLLPDSFKFNYELV